jgi:hypothetical protein
VNNGERYRWLVTGGSGFFGVHMFRPLSEIFETAPNLQTTSRALTSLSRKMMRASSATLVTHIIDPLIKSPWLTGVSGLKETTIATHGITHSTGEMIFGAQISK